MKEFIDGLMGKYLQSKNYQHEQPLTIILDTRKLSNNMIARVTVRITPGNEGDAKFKVMPQSFKFKGTYQNEQKTI